MSMSKARSDQYEELLSKVQHLPTAKINRLNKALEVHAMLKLKDYDLTVTGFRTMFCIQQMGELHLSDIARILQLDRAQISRISKSLTKLGFVYTEKHKSDPRAITLKLTEEGRECLEKLNPYFEARRKLMFEALGEEGQRALDRALQAIQKLDQEAEG